MFLESLIFGILIHKKRRLINNYEQEQMVEPAVNGTKNVILAAAEAKVRRVVFTSSIGAVYMDPNRGPDVVVDESCWSDLEFCKNTKVIDQHEIQINQSRIYI